MLSPPLHQNIASYGLNIAIGLHDAYSKLFQILKCALIPDMRVCRSHNYYDVTLFGIYMYSCHGNCHSIMHVMC